MKKILDETQCLSPEEIRDYLDNKLSGEASFRVENHILDCELCASAIEGYQSSENWKKDLSWASNLQIQPKPTDAKRVRMPLLQKIMAIAALVGLPILAGLWYISTSSDPADLYAKHYNFYDGDMVSSLRGDGKINVDLEMQAALKEYENKNFEPSANAFEAILQKQSNHSNAALHAGLSHLENNNLKKAKEYLRKSKSLNDKNHEIACWYLALAELKTGDHEATKQILNELKTSKDPYFAKKAKALLRDL